MGGQSEVSCAGGTFIWQRSSAFQAGRVAFGIRNNAIAVNEVSVFSAGDAFAWGSSTAGEAGLVARQTAIFVEVKSIVAGQTIIGSWSVASLTVLVANWTILEEIWVLGSQSHAFMAVTFRRASSSTLAIAITLASVWAVFVGNFILNVVPIVTFGDVLAFTGAQL